MVSRIANAVILKSFQNLVSAAKRLVFLDSEGREEKLKTAKSLCGMIV